MTDAELKTLKIPTDCRLANNADEQPVILFPSIWTLEYFKNRIRTFRFLIFPRMRRRWIPQPWLSFAHVNAMLETLGAFVSLASTTSTRKPALTSASPKACSSVADQNVTRPPGCNARAIRINPRRLYKREFFGCT